MSDHSLGRVLALAAACMGAVVLAACGPRVSASPVATLAPYGGAETPDCAPQEILPKITEVQPAKITPGSEVTVIASGGYFKHDCGGFDESARTYQLYLDNEPAADLLCYVNHCEARFKLPERAGVGTHCLGVQKGTCQMEVNVVAE